MRTSAGLEDVYAVTAPVRMDTEDLVQPRRRCHAPDPVLTSDGLVSFPRLVVRLADVISVSSPQLERATNTPPSTADRRDARVALPALDGNEAVVAFDVDGVAATGVGLEAAGPIVRRRRCAQSRCCGRVRPRHLFRQGRRGL